MFQSYKYLYKMSSKHKSEDYKLSVAKYYLRANKTQKEVCDIFGCSPRSLMRWVFYFKYIVFKISP